MFCGLPYKLTVGRPWPLAHRTLAGVFLSTSLSSPCMLHPKTPSSPLLSLLLSLFERAGDAFRWDPDVYIGPFSSPPSLSICFNSSINLQEPFSAECLDFFHSDYSCSTDATLVYYTLLRSWLLLFCFQNTDNFAYYFYIFDYVAYYYQVKHLDNVFHHSYFFFFSIFRHPSLQSQDVQHLP